MKARVIMNVSGAVQFDLDVRTTLHIVEILGSNTPTQTWFLSIASGDFELRAPDGRQLTFDADLAPGLYRGAGRPYELSDKAAFSLGGLSRPSAAYLRLVRLTPPVAETKFDRFAEPCTLDVAKGVVSGTVTCPKLADAKGKSISLRWHWELT